MSILRTGVELQTCAGRDDDGVIREVWAENVYQVLARDLGDTGVCLDLGANIGAFSLFVARFRPEVRVYAYEPNPENHALLVSNAARNGLAANVLPRPQAVAATRGRARFHPQWTCGRLLAEGAIEVETVTLEDVFTRDGLTACDVLKADVEGAEYDIFPGASVETLQRIRYLTMEFHPTTVARFGGLMATLSLAFNTTFFGRYDRGGMIYARRY